MNTRFKAIFGSLPFVVLLLISGCASISRSDTGSTIASQCNGVLCFGNESNSQFASLNPQVRTAKDYANQCDEQMRERQHELVSCDAVPLIVVPLEPKS
jgi:hypothetical protein